jgi:excisionase family DNA binding protein
VNSHRPSSSRGAYRSCTIGAGSTQPSSRSPTLAARLDVCERTVRRWIKARALPVHRIGGLVRVSEADFAAFLALRRET